MEISQRSHGKCAMCLKERNTYHSCVKPRLQQQTYFFVIFCLANQGKKLKPNRDLSGVTFLALSTSRHVPHLILIGPLC